MDNWPLHLFRRVTSVLPAKQRKPNIVHSLTKQRVESSRVLINIVYIYGAALQSLKQSPLIVVERHHSCQSVHSRGVQIHGT